VYSPYAQQRSCLRCILRPVLRRLYRAVFPRLRHPLLDAKLEESPRDSAFGRAYAGTIGASADQFVRARYEEGQRWRHVLRHYTKGGRVLDIGAGNGAIELALAADSHFKPFSIEMLWNDDVRRLARTSGAALRRVIADGARLPFRDGAFDAVTCLETIEHLADAKATGNEIARVTKANGALLVTTPPRWRYALRPDPHFGIRGLALFPASMQRSIASRRGFDSADHYVDRLYGSVRQIAGIFPDYAIESVLSRSRAPRRWFWDALVLRRRG
jgi:SAM-dependent methyltransferase